MGLRTLGKKYRHNRKGTCPLPFFIDEEEKVVWVHVRSSITAMGVPAICGRYFPGYTPKIASMEYLETLREVHEKKLKEKEEE